MTPALTTLTRAGVVLAFAALLVGCAAQPLCGELGQRGRVTVAGAAVGAAAGALIGARHGNDASAQG